VYVRCLVYGTRAVERLFLSKCFKNVVCIFLVLNTVKNKSIIKQACLHNVDVNFVSTDLFKEYFSTANCSESVVAVVNNYCNFSKFEDIVKITKKSIFLVFNKIKDTQNLGACLRTAYLFGVSAVLLSKTNACKMTLGVYKTSSGFFGKVPLFYVDNLGSLLLFFKKNNVYSVGFTHTSDLSLTSLTVEKPIALFFGSEDTGLLKKKICCYDILCGIKMAHNGPLDNLNLSVTVGIVLFELTRLHF
jgi:23S rRNA (guanosine2251-2'-O)-methyltransferase